MWAHYFFRQSSLVTSRRLAKIAAHRSSMTYVIIRCQACPEPKKKKIPAFSSNKQINHRYKFKRKHIQLNVMDPDSRQNGIAAWPTVSAVMRKVLSGK